jgi:hypothetical protein
MIPAFDMLFCYFKFVKMVVKMVLLKGRIEYAGEFFLALALLLVSELEIDVNGDQFWGCIGQSLRSFASLSPMMLCSNTKSSSKLDVALVIFHYGFIYLNSKACSTAMGGRLN